MDQGELRFLQVEARVMSADPMAVTENALQKWVERYAKLQGWLCYHTQDSRRSHSGFPDLVLVRVPDVLFVELKSHKVGAGLKPLQREWLERLAACGMQTHIWKPNMIEQIVRILDCTLPEGQLQ